MEEINIVIIAYRLILNTSNCISKIIESFEYQKIDIKLNIHIICNKLSNNQIKILKDFNGKINKNNNIVFNYIIPYLDIIGDKNIDYLDNLPSDHPSILCYLIKYRLPEKNFLFLDSDCFVENKFLRYFIEVQKQHRDKIFLVPKNYQYGGSLTAPMFYCNIKIVREYLVNIPDFLLCRKTDIYFLDDNSFSEKIKQDTLSDVLLLLINNSALKQKIDSIEWKYNIHMGQGGCLSSPQMLTKEKYTREEIEETIKSNYPDPPYLLNNEKKMEQCLSRANNGSFKCRNNIRSIIKNKLIKELFFAEVKEMNIKIDPLFLNELKETGKNNFKKFD